MISQADSLPAATGEGPISAGQRILALDFIRGIAVLGILFANIVAFAHPSLALVKLDMLPGGGNIGDRVLWLIQFVLVDGKFRGLFSLLFGAGMVLFVDRCHARGSDARVQFLRLVWLGLFGLAHMMLLWTGDILFLYAFAGAIAMIALGWSAKAQLWAGLAWYAIGAAMMTANTLMSAMMEADPQVLAASPQMAALYDGALNDLLAEAGKLTSIISQGSYGEFVAFNWAGNDQEISDALAIGLLETVPLMIMGMGLFRLGLFSPAPEWRRRMRVWGWAGLGIGAAGTLALGLVVYSRGFPFWLTQFAAYGASGFPRLPMIVGLAALLSLMAAKAADGWLGSRLIAAGRMAFTNYIATSGMMLLVFHGWAGGLYGQLHRVELMVVVVLAWAAMLAWSKPWLAHFRYGPLEWLWRCLTYRQIFPITLAIDSKSH